MEGLVPKRSGEIGYVRATHRPNLIPGQPYAYVELPKHRIKTGNRRSNAILEFESEQAVVRAMREKEAFLGGLVLLHFVLQ